MCSVLGGATNYLLGKLDGCQKKSFRTGIIEVFKPRGQNITESDQHISEEIMDIGTVRTLHKFVPKLSVFACKLQLKLPLLSKATTKTEILTFSKLFPKKT